MKSLKILLCLSLVLGFSQAFAEPSTSEKATDSGRDAKRTVKKKAHRVEEKMCAKSDTACLEEKAKNRASEAGDATSDKAKEVKDSMDSNSTPAK